MGEESPGTPYVLGWDQVGLWSPKKGRHGKTRAVTCSHLLKVTSKGLGCGVALTFWATGHASWCILGQVGVDGLIWVVVRKALAACLLLLCGRPSARHFAPNSSFSP